jgi:hypothetical protein
LEDLEIWKLKKLKHAFMFLATFFNNENNLTSFSLPILVIENIKILSFLAFSFIRAKSCQEKTSQTPIVDMVG